MTDSWKPGRKLVIGHTRPDFWLEADGTETTITYDLTCPCGVCTCGLPPKTQQKGYTVANP